jgi:polar amino acid transport system substrate-binding protein
MMAKWGTLLASILFLCLNATGQAETLKLYSIDAPPLTMETGPKKGFVLDIALEAAKRAGYEAELVFIPWKRAQLEVSEGKNSLIIFARTPERDDLYTWVTPLYKMDRAFATLGKQIDSYDQARSQLKQIIVGLGSPQETLLKNNQFTNDQVYSLRIGQKEAEILTAGRADGWFHPVPEMLWRWKEAGSTQKLVVGNPVSSVDVFLACSKNCDAALVQKLAKAVDSMKADGRSDALAAAYLAH